MDFGLHLFNYVLLNESVNDQPILGCTDSIYRHWVLKPAESSPYLFMSTLLLNVGIQHLFIK